jgi:uncharacterized membrane protein
MSPQNKKRKFIITIVSKVAIGASVGGIIGLLFALLFYEHKSIAGIGFGSALGLISVTLIIFSKRK